jgi:hypothetical protein
MAPTICASSGPTLLRANIVSLVDDQHQRQPVQPVERFQKRRHEAPNLSLPEKAEIDDCREALVNDRARDRFAFVFLERQIPVFAAEHHDLVARRLSVRHRLQTPVRARRVDDDRNLAGIQQLLAEDCRRVGFSHATLRQDGDRLRDEFKRKRESRAAVLFGSDVQH